MDRQAFISPCNGKKGQENVKIKSFFRPVNNSLVNPVKASEKGNSVGVIEQPTSSKTQATLELAVTNSEKAGAEILWALNSVSSVYFNSSELFQSMFFDSKIEKSWQMGPTKLRYLVKLWNCSIF